METELTHAVLQQLHEGKDKAIPSKILAKRLGFKDDRKVRLAVRELIANGVPIVGRHGYFIADDYKDIADELEFLRSYIKELALRMRDIKKSGKTLWNEKQLRLV